MPATVVLRSDCVGGEDELGASEHLATKRVKIYAIAQFDTGVSTTHNLWRRH